MKITIDCMPKEIAAFMREMRQNENESLTAEQIENSVSRAIFQSFQRANCDRISDK